MLVFVGVGITRSSYCCNNIYYLLLDLARFKCYASIVLKVFAEIREEMN